jgi:hypothetical protein
MQNIKMKLEAYLVACIRDILRELSVFENLSEETQSIAASELPDLRISPQINE